MLDAITIDQMRTFIAAVDEGSFSAAGRKLSKSLGNGPEPGELASRHGADALRWW